MPSEESSVTTEQSDESYIPSTDELLNNDNQLRRSTRLRNKEKRNGDLLSMGGVLDISYF